MEWGDGFDDDPSSFRPPPPVDDRLWRHPSELGPAPSGRRRSPSPWAVGLLSGLVGALLALGIVAVAGGTGQRTVVRPIEHVVIQREEGPAVTPAAAAAASGGAGAAGAAGAGGGSGIVDIAQRVRPAITQIIVTGKNGGGSGSGVLFRSDGHVLTNNHVVDGADGIKVVLANGRELPGQVVGTDADTDVAVVKIDGGPYPVATLGSAVNLKVGQQAIAIGSPLGLAGGPSVTVGVVSALHRRVDARGGSSSLVDMIQTDAPISPGSSGGALLDGDGAVIGVTTAIAVSDVGAEGLGFATPIDVARQVAEQLIATGHAVHVYLGIEGTDLDGDSAGKMHVDGGALVRTVIKGSPADHAGLVARDVIVGADGKPVASMAALVALLRSHAPGERVSLDVVRDDQRLHLTATLVEKPKAKPAG